MLAMLIDAIQVLQDTTSIRREGYERERTETFLWFYEPQLWADDDPFSFESVAETLGLSASAIRRQLAGCGPALDLGHIGRDLRGPAVRRGGEVT